MCTMTGLIMYPKAGDSVLFFDSNADYNLIGFIRVRAGQPNDTLFCFPENIRIIRISVLRTLLRANALDEAGLKIMLEKAKEYFPHYFL